VSSPPPAETSADAASSCLVLIKRAVSRLHVQRCGKGNCEKAAVGSRGRPGIAAKFGPGGPLSRGDCPRRESNLLSRRLQSVDNIIYFSINPAGQQIYSVWLARLLVILTATQTEGVLSTVQTYSGVLRTG